MKSEFAAVVSTILIACSVAGAESTNKPVVNSIGPNSEGNLTLTWGSVPTDWFTIYSTDELSTNTVWDAVSTNLFSAGEATSWTDTTGQLGILPDQSGFQASAPASASSDSIKPNQSFKYEPMDLPPLPWDDETKKKYNGFSGEEKDNFFGATSSSQSDAMQGPMQKFYRVGKLDIPPTANPDFVGVQQDSISNQFDVLVNDSDPNSERLQIANVTSPSNGVVSYTNSSSAITYTPAATFFGVDTFSYTITNDTGLSAPGRVTVFVNKAGNEYPALGDITLILPTNVFSTNFSALADAYDPDGDAISLYSLANPRLGTVYTNTSGTIFYSRDTNSFGLDAFTYVIIDGNGGFAQVNVVIDQEDSDEDEMPDAWEHRYGLDPTADDAGADPDGDGLPNLAEFKLRTNPHSSDNPLQLWTITDGIAVSNTVYLPLLLHPQVDNPPITLYVDDEPAANASLQLQAFDKWYVRWDMSYLTNGVHNIKLAFHHRPIAPLDETTRVFGPSKQVYVDNLIQLDPLTSQFGAILFLRAKSKITNADYRIELFDDFETPLVYFEGSVTNGLIDLTWDLKVNGQQIAFGNIRADFYVVPSGQQGFGPFLGKPVRRWFPKDVFGGIGDGFVIAWGWDEYSSTFEDRRLTLMLQGVINILGNPARSDEYTLAPSDNAPFGSAFRYDTASDQTTLLNALTNTDNGNFFWFGHGNAIGIYGNDKKSALTTGFLESALKNKAHRSTAKLARTNEHPYRLAIMNGCETYSADWANAFGIDFSPKSTTNTVNDYSGAGREPRAFVGWKGEIDVPGHRFGGGGNRHPEYTAALADLFDNWMERFTLESCLINFEGTAGANGFSNADTWSISGCRNLLRLPRN